MLGLQLHPPGQPLKVLALGAHGDDIEIGCGGTLLDLQQRYELHVRWVVMGCADDTRAREAEESAQTLLGPDTVDVSVGRYPDAFLPYRGEEVKREFERLKVEIEPGLIFTHYRHDLHQDHRLMCELTWNTFRDHMILEYEIPKYDGDLTTPNVYVPLDEETRRKKVALLMQAFASQRDKRWFTPATFEGLLRLRGIECASPTGYAEAFHAHKVVLGFSGVAALSASVQ